MPKAMTPRAARGRTASATYLQERERMERREKPQIRMRACWLQGRNPTTPAWQTHNCKTHKNAQREHTQPRRNDGWQRPATIPTLIRATTLTELALAAATPTELSSPEAPEPEQWVLARKAQGHKI